MADVPFVRGTSATLRFYFNTGEVVVRCKTWKLTEDVTEVQDDVGGEDASRLDTVHNFWNFEAEAYYRDGKVLQAALQNRLNDMQGLAPMAKIISIKAVARDGSKFAGSGREVAWDAIAVSMNGRTDAVTIPLKWRSRYFDQKQAV